MVNPKVSLLLPSAYRPRQLRRAIEMAFDSTGLPLELCVSIVSDDYESAALTRDYALTFDMRTRAEYDKGAIYAWNKLAAKASGDVLVLWADDLVPECNWLEKALAHLEQLGNGLIGFNDLYSDGTVYAAHWLASRRFLIDVLGGVMYPPHYHSWWCDREVTDKAMALCAYKWARDVIVEHQNYTFGASKIDDTYRGAIPYYATDEMIYNARKAQGFPIDYEAVIK